MSFQNSYGLILQEGTDGEKVFITTDTQFAPSQMKYHYKDCDLIFHDCGTSFPDGVHAHYDDLVTLPLNFKEKFRLYPYQPNPTQILEDDGFLGFVTKGQTFEVYDSPQEK